MTNQRCGGAPFAGIEADEHISGIPQKIDLHDHDEDVEENYCGYDFKSIDEDVVRQLIFQSVEDAENFYTSYAKVAGFGIRKQGVKRKNGDLVKYREWVCTREGFRRKSKNEYDRKREARAVTRCGCKAGFRVAHDRVSEHYTVTRFDSQHNHDLQGFKERYISMPDKSMLNLLTDFGVRPCEVMDLLEQLAGGPGKISFTRKDGYNWLSKMRRNRIRGGDINTSSALFESMKDYVSPPVLSRYPKRQRGPLHSPLRSPIRGPMITPAQSPQLQSPPEDQVHHATSASTFSVPHNTLDVPTNFGDSQEVERISPQEVERIGPAEEVERVVDQDPKETSCRSQSFNVTEYVLEQQDDVEDDPIEVESVLDPAFDLIDGHKLKKEIAPLLRDIFQKHGDITSRCDIGPSNFLSLCLECVCDLYRRLEQTTFDKVTCIELSKMLEEVSHLESQKLSLKWLREKLEYVSETKTCIQDYAKAKDEMAKNKACIDVKKKKLEGYERELADLQEKISTAKKELRAEEAKSAESKKMCLDIKARVASLRHQSLVDGLL